MARKRRFAVGCLSIILVVFAYRILAVYKFRPGSCGTGAITGARQNTYPKRLVVMSYNIQGHAALLRGNHIEKIAEAIVAEHPDVVAINEAHRRTWQARFRDHVAELQARTKMNGAFRASYTLAGGEFGNLVLTRGRILGTKVHTLPGTGEPRTLLEVTTEIDGGIVTVFVTHTAAWRDFNRASRADQLKCIANHLRASRYPFLLAGDLNAPPESPEIAEFRAIDNAQMAGTGDTHKVMKQQLDYIFADKGWSVHAARVVDGGPSDHRPVIAELLAPQESGDVRPR